MRKGDSCGRRPDASCWGRFAAIPQTGPLPRFLKTLLVVEEICLVRTPEVYTEWTRHWSKFARSWYVSMEARKRVLRPTVTAVHQRTCKSIEDWAPSEPARLAILKDMHLLLAAISADQRIASLDETLRSILAASCADLPHLCNLLWLNPERPEERAEDWIRRGAPFEDARTLRRARD
jgi:hypothetical protein